jgi:hypothetical protein
VTYVDQNGEVLSTDTVLGEHDHDHGDDHDHDHE